MQDLVVIALRQLVMQAPMLIAYTVGIVCALIYWRRYPRPCLYTLIATGTMLILAVLGTVLHIYLFGYALPRLEWTTEHYAAIMTVFGIAGSVTHAAAFGLLLAAVFNSRPRVPAAETAARIG